MTDRRSVSLASFKELFGKKRRLWDKMPPTDQPKAGKRATQINQHVYRGAGATSDEGLVELVTAGIQKHDDDGGEIRPFHTPHGS